ncbi:MAG: NADH-quinone oxidoreductase subunit H [Actinobacteria bacterium]|nr:NADH-quinone oxidoreductase subunit H [Actinomycetota bacterium]
MTTAELIAADSGTTILIKALLVFIFCVLLTLMSVWGERRLVGRMQERPGPNRVGPFGLIQALADGVKLALKEDLIPAAADKIVFVLAPIISATTCFMSFAVIPITGEVSLFGQKTAMQLTDLPVGVLYVAAQSTWWYGVVLFPSFAIYAISMVGETNRAPFDLAEAEGELVGGFHTEYSSLKFALFFLAEYVNIIAVSALATTLFLGGYHAPPGLGFTEAWLGGWFTGIWFFSKVLVFFFVFVWLRGTLPRLRYDQFMQFGWKILIPVSILWILVVATLRTLSLEGAPRIVVIGFASFVVLLVMAANIGFENAKKKKLESLEVEVSEPSFAVPTVPMNVSNINVSQSSKGGDHV